MQIVNSLKYSSSNLTRACYFIRNCVWIPVWSYLFSWRYSYFPLTSKFHGENCLIKVFSFTRRFLIITNSGWTIQYIVHSFFRNTAFLKKNLWTCHFYKEVWSVIIERMHVCMQAYFWSKFIQREKDASKSQKPGVVFLWSPKHFESWSRTVFFFKSNN